MSGDPEHWEINKTLSKNYNPDVRYVKIEYYHLYIIKLVTRNDKNILKGTPGIKRAG